MKYYILGNSIFPFPTHFVRCSLFASFACSICKLCFELCLAILMYLIECQCPVPSVFKHSVCESQFDLINIVCWYETKNVSGIYRTFHNEDR